MANALNKVNSGGIEDGSIVNADIKSDAAIAGSKLVAATTSVPGSMSAADKTKLDGVATSATAVGGATGVDFNDSVKARFGTGNDLEIFHDGTHSRIKDTGTGGLYASASIFKVTDAAVSENMLLATENGAVELYYDGTKKLETSSTGGVLTGAWTTTNGLLLHDITYGNSTQNREVTDSSNWQDVTSDNVNRTMAYNQGDLIVIDAHAPCGIALQSDGDNHGGMYVRLKITDGSTTAYGDTQKAWYRNDNEAINELIQYQQLKYIIGTSDTTFANASTLTVSFQFKHIASQGTVGTSLSRWDSNRWISVTRYKKST